MLSAGTVASCKRSGSIYNCCIAGSCHAHQTCWCGLEVGCQHTAAKCRAYLPCCLKDGFASSLICLQLARLCYSWVDHITCWIADLSVPATVVFCLCFGGLVLCCG